MANENSEQDIKTTPDEVGQTRKFTNILQEEDPESWEYINQEGNVPKFAPGATKPTGTGAVAEKSSEPYPQEEVPPDPRLGMAQQGEYDVGRMQSLFPEMFLQTSSWLDPREQARKEAGMSYDPNKKYKEDEGGQAQGVMAQQRPMTPARIDRNQFEGVVFDRVGKLTGIKNPFMFNPYDELVKADKKLPEIFNAYFRGHATYKDLPNLSKEQRAAWDNVKKQYHAQVYDGAKAKQQQAMDMYKWMMGKFDYEQKSEQAQQAREARQRATDAARAGKTPTLKALPNANNEMTLHQYDPATGDWNDTGRRTGLATFVDRMPPEIKNSWETLENMRKNGLIPKLDPQAQMLLTMVQQSNPKLAESMMSGLMQGSSPEARKIAEQHQKSVLDWLQKETTGAMKQPAAQAQAPAKPASAKEVMDDVGKIAAALKAGKSIDYAVEVFSFKYKATPKAVETLQKILKKAGYQPPASARGTIPAKPTSQEAAFSQEAAPGDVGERTEMFMH